MPSHACDCTGRFSSLAGFHASDVPSLEAACAGFMAPLKSPPTFCWCLTNRQAKDGFGSGVLCLKHAVGKAASGQTVCLPCAVRLILTAVAGSVGGLFLVAAWWRFGILMLCMLCVGLVLGFLVSSVTFFTPLGKKCVTDVCVFSSLFERSYLGSLGANTASSGIWGLLG